MPTTSSQYGTYNPGGIDPFPIESTLAQIVGTNNPAEAGNLLDVYRTQNQTASANYDYALNQQHEFAKQQLAQQLYEANLKGLAEAKDPSVLQLMVGNPTYAGVIGDNRANIADVLSRSRAAQNATTLEHSAAGAYSAAQAGRDLTDSQASAASGGLLGPQGTPLSTRNELIKEAGANARAAATAAGDKSSFQFPANPDYPGVVMTGRPNKGETDIQYLERKKREGFLPGQVALPNIPGKTQTNAPPAPGTTSASPSQTNVPNAPPGQRVSGMSPGLDPVQKAVNDHIENVVRTQNPAAYKDIMTQAQKNNGRPQLIRDAKGNITGVQGATRAW